MAGTLGELKKLPEDVVEYYIFPDIPSQLEGRDVLDFLNKQKDSILAHLGRRLVKYIWQHEPFNLRPVISSQDSIPSHLHGSTNFGDNIDDEWFIVSMLYDITREFSGTVIRVSDNDEEFLLIEAAEELPKWLDPETAENRVYVYNGDLHVIPIPQATEDFEKYPLFTPTKSEAIACVRNCAYETRCSQAVQKCIQKRLSCFPRKSKESTHSVNCYLPTPLAVVLSEHPGLVSAGVRSFYYRDPLELKACCPMKRFKPDDLVRTRVKMTRCLYAQLVQQQFLADKRSGWAMVSPSNPEFLERDIGMKLAHGFEILCSKCLDETDVFKNGEKISDSDVRWQQFKRALKSNGYFRGEIEGSKLYQELLREAKEFFLAQINESESSDSESMGQQVLKYVKELEPKMDEYRHTERSLPPSDDDTWLHLSPDQVDRMVKSASGLSTSSSASDTFDLSKIAEGMSSFVEHESGLEGAEFPKEASTDGDGQFESSGLIQAMQKMFDFPEDKDSSGSDMSEYDWSDGSDDELGSPTKVPVKVKKSSMKKSRSNQGGTSSKKSMQRPKAVHFSPVETLDESETATNGGKEQKSASNLSNKPSSKPQSITVPQPNGSKSPSSPHQGGATSPTSRPTVAPPPRPSSSPASPPVPPSRPSRKAPLSKANGVVKPSAPPPPPPPKRDKKLDALMEAMDQELAATDVGKSFERTPKQPKPKRPTRPPTRPPPPKQKPPKAPSRDIDDEDDDFRPVNVDLNLVKNTLESYKAQQGLPGPASNILEGLGIKLPQDQGVIGGGE